MTPAATRPRPRATRDAGWVSSVEGSLAATRYVVRLRLLHGMILRDRQGLSVGDVQATIESGAEEKPDCRSLYRHPSVTTP